MELGFNNTKYVKIQSAKIKERISIFDKLYLEIGGKLFDDTHATRVLPGFKSDSKIKMFLELKNDLEIIFCINAKDIEKNKTRNEYGITYDIEIIRLINKALSLGFSINSVVITLYQKQISVDKFIKKLNRQGIKTYIHTFTKGYPNDVETIVSKEGYGANEYIKTTKPLVLVNAPGPGSGKLATCLSQLYHEHTRGINAGYAKFETFPVWNLDLKHPVNMAYEAATADLKDVNMIDSFHLKAYNKIAVNYNRDLELFPVLQKILLKITNNNIYNSPTDMGVNMIGFCINNNKVIEESAKKEIVRRYYNEQVNYKKGIVDEDVPRRIEMLMNELNIDKYYLKVVKPALKKAKKENLPVIAMELPNGKIITGKQTKLLSPASSLIINSLKELTNIPDKIQLLSPSILKPITKLKNISDNKENKLQLQEALIALSISSVTNPVIKEALSNLDKLNNLNAHASYIIENGDFKALKSLNINFTCEPEFYLDKIYYN